MGSVVTGWGRLERGIEDGGEWIRRGRKSSWIVAQEKVGRVKGIRIGIRR
jgi:hypothetical protein